MAWLCELSAVFLNFVLPPVDSRAGEQGSLANEPDSPVTRVYETVGPFCLAYEPRSPGGTRPPGSFTEQKLRKQNLQQYQFFNGPGLRRCDNLMPFQPQV